MAKFNAFFQNNYMIFFIASIVLLLALIGYFIEKKNAEKTISKEEELKTINIQQQVNQNATLQNVPAETLDGVNPVPVDVQTVAQPNIAAPQMQEVQQPVNQGVVTQQTTTDNKTVVPGQNNSNNDDNIEILG